MTLINPDDYTQSHEEEKYRRMCKVSLIHVHKANGFHDFRHALNGNMKHTRVYLVYRV